jgi:hypothetical protein
VAFVVGAYPGTLLLAELTRTLACGLRRLGPQQGRRTCLPGRKPPRLGPHRQSRESHYARSDPASKASCSSMDSLGQPFYTVPPRFSPSAAAVQVRGRLAQPGRDPC